MRRDSWCVIYRRGGYANFTWHRSMSYTTHQEAVECFNEVTRMGYPCYVERYYRSMAIGLPETFIPGPVPY